MRRSLGALILAALPALGSGAARAAVTTRWAHETVDGVKVDVFQAFDADDRRRRPGVLMFHNNVDGVSPWIQEQARKLAAQGYVVMAPVLTGPADLGGIKDATKLSHERRIQVSVTAGRRAAAALALLRKNGRVQADRVGAVGYCHLGGPAAMDLARSGAPIEAVATFWGGVSPTDLSSMWGRRRLTPRVLVMLGGSDVETNPYLPAFEDEMRLSKADWRLVLYGRASHAFTIPGHHPDDRGVYDPEADRRSWRELSDFLQETLKGSAAPANPG